MVCGQLIHTGAPVVLWLDPGGYDASRPEGRSPTTNPAAVAAAMIASPQPTSAPAATAPASAPSSAPAGERRGRFNRRGGGGGGGSRWGSGISRNSVLTDEELAHVLANGWDIDLLKEKVDQFVIHFDVAGISRTCFAVLQQRGLAVQFMLDIDGTIYQTMDLKELAAHATKANGRSVGIEIANMGSYPASSSLAPLKQWYSKDSNGRVRITVPERLGDGGVRTPHFVGRPARDKIVEGNVQGEMLRQYDFTPEQYNSLIHLTAALCTVLPKITCDYPRQKTRYGPPTTAATTQSTTDDPATSPGALASFGDAGALIPHRLTDEQYDDYQGVLGHYHVQFDKVDPGPAFQWDRVINGARALMSSEAKIANIKARGRPVRYRPPSSTQPATTRAVEQQERGAGEPGL